MWTTGFKHLPLAAGVKVKKKNELKTSLKQGEEHLRKTMLKSNCSSFPRTPFVVVMITFSYFADREWNRFFN